ncbi:MAG TPA: hypothetical protein ENJ28_12235 [Gammaproteobacteria bacterium]|nr:hypothetical protein [Gammaproteobacteria bacterium]
MDINKIKIKYIKELIAEDYLNEAIDEAKILFKETDFYDEVILNSTRLAELDRKERAGTLDEDEMSKTKAKIRNSLLKIIRNSKRKPVKEDKSEDSSESTFGRKLSPIPNEKGFTEGDYITAAIVHADHVEKLLKKLVRQIKDAAKMPNDEAIEYIESKVEEEIKKERNKAENFNKNDEEERLDACIATLVADVVERELINFGWNVEENKELHPYVVFKNTVKEYIKFEKERWKSK